jgi:hypothetical protein
MKTTIKESTHVSIKNILKEYNQNESKNFKKVLNKDSAIVKCCCDC